MCAITIDLFYSVLLALVSSLVPYTTLFRSARIGLDRADVAGFVADPAGTRAMFTALSTDLGARHWRAPRNGDRKSTRLNSSHLVISYAVFCLKKKKHK